MSMEELQDNSNIMRSANGIFNRNCAMCHGESGLGQANTFPNLMDGDWQWGATLTQIEQTIRLGRNASMPAWNNRLNDEEILQVVNFIQDWGNTNNIQNNNPGKVIYDQLCIGCHGPNGTGNVILGAPNLADTIWLYGKTDRALKETISNGRSGLMPGFQDRLNDVEIRLLIAWLTK
jgi:cytochrome c oxidase cbb3-type subunit III